MIKVWEWDDAPQEYKDFSHHGGDEDLVVVVPVSIWNAWPLWFSNIYRGIHFAEPSINFNNNEVILIYAHA